MLPTHLRLDDLHKAKQGFDYLVGCFRQVLVDVGERDLAQALNWPPAAPVMDRPAEHSRRFNTELLASGLRTTG